MRGYTGPGQERRRLASGPGVAAGAVRLRAIGNAGVAVITRAVGAAEPGAVGFDAVANHAAAAVQTDGGELMDRALKAVERIAHRARDDDKGLVVVVSAGVAA